MTAAVINRFEPFGLLGTRWGVCALAALALYSPIMQIRMILPADAEFHATLQYLQTYLELNYFDHGFIRRGLPGALAKVLGIESSPESIAAAYLIGLGWPPCTALIRRIS